jgi:two-component system CheB/CheR fusion protein
VSISGPDLLLTPNAAATLGMVFYELVTNAAKYGALSEAGGRIEVTWQTAHSVGDDHVVLTWSELDGPRPPANFTDGFGLAFVKRSIDYELQGSTTLEPLPVGVRWKVEFPVNGNIQRQ